MRCLRLLRRLFMFRRIRGGLDYLYSARTEIVQTLSV